MLRTGSAPVSSILTEKEAVGSSQQRDTTSSPQLPMAPPEENTELLHPVYSSLQAGSWMCHHLLSLSRVFRFIESQWMWERWVGMCWFVLSSSARLQDHHGYEPVASWKEWTNSSFMWWEAKLWKSLPQDGTCPGGGSLDEDLKEKAFQHWEVCRKPPAAQ